MKIDDSLVVEASNSVTIDGIGTETFLSDLQNLVSEVVAIKLWRLKVVDFGFTISFLGVNKAVNGAFDSCDDLFDESDDVHFRFCF